MKIRQRTTCHTCRARKLGCDGLLPYCSQCLLSGRECAGYKHDYLFVHHVIQPSLKCSKVKIPKKPSIPKGGNNISLDYFVALIISQYAPWLIPFNDQYCFSTPTFRICGSWVGVLPELLQNCGENRILPSAVTSLGLLLKNKYCLDERSTLACVTAQCVTLGHIRRRLSENPNGPFDAKLVAASMCLSLAECISPTSQAGWIAHLQGLSKIIEVSGPEHYTSGVHHQLFVGMRTFILFEAFQHRKSTFLASKSWQTVPFTTYALTPLQTLLNHAAMLPGLMERLDDLETSLSEANVLAHKLVTEISEVLATLSDWESSYRLGFTGAPYWSKPSVDSSASFPTADDKNSLWFVDILAANAFTHLWALQILCISECEKLQHRFPDLAGDSLGAEASIPAHSSRLNINTLSTWICKSMEYLMQDEGRMYGPILSTLFPLRVVNRIFASDGSGKKTQMEWCQSIVDKLIFKGVDLTSLL